MAQRGRPKGSKNKQPSSRVTAAAAEANRRKSIIWSAVLLALGVLMLVLMLVSDRGVLGTAMQKGMKFMFSWVMYLWPALLVYIGLLLAFEKTQKYIAVRFWCSVIALILFSAIVFTIGSQGADLKSVFDGSNTNAVGFGLGYVFTKLLGRVGGLIALFLMLAASFMVAAGITIVSVFVWLKNLFTVGADDDDDGSVEAIRNIGREQPQKPEKKAKAKSRIDIPVLDGPPPEQPDYGSVPIEPQRHEIRIDDIISKATSPAAEPEPQTKAQPEAAQPAESSAERREDDEYTFPSFSLLKKSVGGVSEDVSHEMKENAEKVVRTLRSFGVAATMSEVCRGPSVTRYELQPDAGVKISKITGLADDLALSLAAESVRIEAPIPNKAAVGIEVPNKKRSPVFIRDILETREFADSHSRLTIALGKDISGQPVVADLASMPHMLIAGATGSGKSVCLNSIIMSILYKSSPDEVKFIMIDPKAVELVIYNGIPHLAIPVVTDPRRAAGALEWAVREMLQRYKLFSEAGTRDITSYNLYVKGKEELEPLTQYVIIIDELYYLMMAAAKEVEESICKIAQLARAAGMHLVVATQRPSVDVITGLIKANIPSRIALAVSSQFDSRTIIDHGGAEKLLGKGDMLFAPIDASKAQRVQGCYLSEDEVRAVVGSIKEKAQAKYDEEINKAIDDYASDKKEREAGAIDGSDGEVDEMLEAAIEIAVESQTVSTSLLQRRLKLGYARAARIVDEMEARGIVGPFEGSKPRQVLLSRTQWMEMKNRQ